MLLSLFAIPVVTGIISTVAAKQNCVTSAPAKSAASKTDQTICLQDGSQREYTVYLPEDYTSSTTSGSHSLILSYHGGTVTREDQEQLDLLTEPYFNQDAVVVYPSGLDKTWQGVPGSSANDTGFTSELIDLLLKDYKIDKNRIYATGKSDGGGFVGILACDPVLSTRIAAFAPVSGAFYPGKDVSQADCNADLVEVTCNPGRSPVPIIEFHGLLDTTIPYYGGEHNDECLPTIPRYLTQWAGRDDEGPTNETSVLTKDTVVYTFPGGLVKGYLDANLYHEWPSTTPNPDNKKHNHVATFNATSIILEFFKQNPLSSTGLVNGSVNGSSTGLYPSGTPKPSNPSGASSTNSPTMSNSATSTNVEGVSVRAALALPLMLLSAFTLLY